MTYVPRSRSWTSTCIYYDCDWSEYSVFRRVKGRVVLRLGLLWTWFVQTLESPEIKMLRFPGMESPGKGHRSWKTLENSWNFVFWFKYHSLERKFIVIHCVHFFTIGIAFGLVYYNAVTSKTALVCALFDLMQPCLWMECILESPWKRIFEFWKTVF